MGGFPEDFEYGEDQFLWGKIALSYPVAYSWNGLAIYHTEALGRICNTFHPVKEQPFALYLRQELEHCAIPSQLQSECRQYIRRKHYSGIFSALIMGNFPACEKRSMDHDNKIPGSGTTGRYSGFFSRMIGGFANRIYNSSIHDTVRLLACRIYRCYNPGGILVPVKNDVMNPPANPDELSVRK
jgi:hypothetical protein